MSVFQVIELNNQWGAIAVNPNNPNDRVLANLCETQAYAEMMAADLNRIAEIDPSDSPLNEPEISRKKSYQANSIFDPNGEPYRRKIRFED
jgi:hypothetical protein